MLGAMRHDVIHLRVAEHKKSPIHFWMGPLSALHIKQSVFRIVC
ncbi:hypothetical protein APT_01450 [Acetobacter pasteurianus NBRC 101655]|nr:hypothetical protein APT_01450 [Acetobacter pasteurianus NBRC 101655]CCT58427.1 hypothetical protein APA386B_308 [Acetobacter pasteurianus 386B]